MGEDTRERLGRVLNAPPDPPLEATRKFLQSYCADEDSLETIRAAVRRMAAINRRTLVVGLEGIDSLLENPVKEGVLAQLVAYDAGWVLDDPSDAGARAWLKDVAQMVREELGGKRG